MKRMCWATVAIGIICFSLDVLSHVEPGFISLLLSGLFFVLLIIVLLASFSLGLMKWRHTSRWWPISALAALAFLLITYYLTAPTGQYICDWRFEKDIAKFSKVVDGIRNGSIPVVIPSNYPSSYRYGEIDVANMPSYIGDIRGAHCDDGGIAVFFGAKFHAFFLHEGYFYKGYGEKSNCSSDEMKPFGDAYYIRHITGPWYIFSSEPGF